MFLRAAGARTASGVSLLGGVGLLGYALSRYAPVITLLRALADEAEASAPLGAILKMLGMAYLTQIAADTCRDMGESVLAGRIELCGRAEILLLCLPYLEELCRAVQEVLA